MSHAIVTLPLPHEKDVIFGSLDLAFSAQCKGCGYDAYIIHFIEFTYYHNKLRDQALHHEHTKYDPLINTIQSNGWKVKPMHHHHIRGQEES